MLGTLRFAPLLRRPTYAALQRWPSCVSLLRRLAFDTLLRCATYASGASAGLVCCGPFLWLLLFGAAFQFDIAHADAVESAVAQVAGVGFGYRFGAAEVYGDSEVLGVLWGGIAGWLVRWLRLFLLPIRCFAG